MQQGVLPARIHKFKIARKSLTTLMLVALISFSLQFAINTAANAAGNTYIVDTVSELSVNTDSTHGSFKWAVEQANASPGHDTIEFEIPAEDQSPNGSYEIPFGVQPIAVNTPITIDGYTQTNASSCQTTHPIVFKNTTDRNRPLDINNGVDAGSEVSLIRGITYQSVDNNFLNLNGDNITVKCNNFNLEFDASASTEAGYGAGLGVFGNNLKVGDGSDGVGNYFGGNLTLENSHSSNLYIQHNVFGWTPNFTSYIGPYIIGGGYQAVDGLYISNNYAQGVNLRGNPLNKDVELYGNLICTGPANVNPCEGVAGTGILIEKVENLNVGASGGGTNNYINGG